MRSWLVVLCLLSACTTVPIEPLSEDLFQDERFQPSSERIARVDVFELNSAMHHYLEIDIARDLRDKGPTQGLIEALRDKGDLKLEYDTVKTRNAASAFDARAGNCLSLVIMTAALAKSLGVPVEYHSVLSDEIWSRSGDIYFANGHVNLTLGKMPRTGVRVSSDAVLRWTIDFVPPDELRPYRARVIGEDTIVAMYMNNRAAEALARAQLDDAYWWAREAIRQDARFLSAYITLAVAYRRHGDLAQAERVLQHVLDVEPENANALSNLVLLLNETGRRNEAARAAAKLARIEPEPPFYFYERGWAAMKKQDFPAARDLFSKALEREAYYHEFHFGLAAAYLALGERAKAQQQLAYAVEYSTTRKDRDLYAAKLDWLTTLQQSPRQERVH